MATTAVVLASPLVPGPRRPLLVAVGSELEPALRQLEPDFERQHPSIDLRWEVLGAQEMVNRQLDGGGERARVLIPSNGAQLRAYAAARRSRGPGKPFAVEPVPIARTVLVAVAWPDRARRMFPDGRFSWQRLRTVAEAGQWSALGAPAEWGSVDLRCTDPLRSSSGQMTLALWSRNQPRQMAVQALRRAVYRPARSTDILLQVATMATLPWSMNRVPSIGWPRPNNAIQAAMSCWYPIQRSNYGWMRRWWPTMPLATSRTPASWWTTCAEHPPRTFCATRDSVGQTAAEEQRPAIACSGWHRPRLPTWSSC